MRAGSSLHRTHGKTLDEIALRIERQRQRGRDRDDDGRRDLAVLDARRRDEGERAHRHRLLVGRGEDQREDEVVPGEDEGEQARRRDAGLGQRDRDLA